MSFLVRRILEVTAEAQKPDEHISLHQDPMYLETIEEENKSESQSGARKNTQRAPPCCS